MIVVAIVGVVIVLLAIWALWAWRTLNSLRWYGGSSSWTVRRNERRMRANLRVALGREP